MGMVRAHFMRLWTPSLPILKAVRWKDRRGRLVGIEEAKALDRSLGKACWLVVVESRVRRIVDASVIEKLGARKSKYMYYRRCFGMRMRFGEADYKLWVRDCSCCMWEESM